MEARDVKTIADLKVLIEERRLSQIKVGLVDMDGVMCGKYMSRDKFLCALEGGFGFCDVVFGWDVGDKLYDNTLLTGWGRGYGDAEVRLIPESCRDLPLEGDMIFVQGEVVGRLESLCPRGLLRRVLERARAMGFDVLAGFEYEFLAVDEDNEALQQRLYQHPKPLGSGAFGYSILRSSVNTDFYRALLDLCERMQMPIEGLHEETGPGALEAALCVDNALRAADNAVCFKTFSKVLAEKQGRMLCYMAKWHQEQSGQGGHIHISLRRRDGGDSAFHQPGREHAISDAMRHFIGGIQRLMPEFMSLAAPTVNSFRRLVPGYWAPTSSLWGVDNRTVAIRAIPGSAKSQRVEYRLPGADSNPYLALASGLAAGLYGIEHRIEPEEPVSANGYLLDAPPHLKLHRTLWEAAQALRASSAARDWFGDDFVDHFAATREWEEREFQRHVTDWELKRYFEII
ncbi:glutamine synthetase family protein [Chromobacterium haemolyticum]|uniref:glutamine synthetase family protein n=1 Tax=Chromobacterium haemolyticum TaxID=394935 RepID=UPI000D3266E4|nr:glutamine synthetase [Chromobacterium haemolyticum]MDH0339921.1 glutamine synthetase [Chromobacterium haemolyticum]PTU70464.1 glutamine synthetase [Chromobacterium haemolyticum]BBH12555.1 glutamine synthetase [Chromobacterium haemolyticum]